MPIRAYPKPSSSRLRRGRFSETGRIYLVTFSTTNREKAFAQPQVAIAAIKALREAAIEYRSELCCWVLMPDHWHGLVRLGERIELSELVRCMKGRSARAVNALLEARGRLWDRGFHDHALRSDESLRAVARYIVLNPVRAGLVRKVGLYPFWDAVWLDSWNRDRG